MTIGLRILLLLAVGWMWVVHVQAATGPYETPGVAVPQNQLDDCVFSRLQKLGITPAANCSDPVFIRRVYLDTIGTLPTPREVTDFLQSKDPGKRQLLIDRLLERDEFADYWAMKWSDLLRVKAEFPINLWPNAAQAYHRWIRTSIRDNMSYDRFTRELLTGNGSNFRTPQVNFYRALQSKEPSGVAQAVALTFMGVRTDQWPAEKLSGMAACFSRIGYKETSEWKEEIVFFDPAKSNAQPAVLSTVTMPDGKTLKLSAERDPREAFADWLIDRKNPWFTRNIANRAWSWFFGRGIIHEPDDLRPDNPCANPELLATLEQELIGADYNLKHLFRLILQSRTYQLSSIPASQHAQAEANFAFYPVRRLEAEVIIDALCQITGTTERYSSAIPEPFTYVPRDVRSIALPDGSISSPFLEMFGRPPRDTGLESERNNRVSPAQRLHLLNSSHVQSKLDESGFIRNLVASAGAPRETANAVYLKILSRYPTQTELQAIAEYARAGEAKRREVLVDLAWALVNTAEFQFRH